MSLASATEAITPSRPAEAAVFANASTWDLTDRFIPKRAKSDLSKLVKIVTPQETVCGIAYRHQGGQRATLSQELHDTLVDHLLNGSPVTIHLVGYRTTLEPSAFASLYQKMQKTPFHIPIKRLI